MILPYESEKINPGIKRKEGSVLGTSGYFQGENRIHGTSRVQFHLWEQVQLGELCLCWNGHTSSKGKQKDGKAAKVSHAGSQHTQGGAASSSVEWQLPTRPDTMAELRASVPCRFGDLL